MTGLNTKRLLWTIFFLGVTLAAIVAEVVAGVWHPAGTIPWTEYIAQYVPWPIQLTAYVILAVWLPFHFYRADAKRKAEYARGLSAGWAKGHSLGYLDGRKAERHEASRVDTLMRPGNDHTGHGHEAADRAIADCESHGG